MESDEPKVPSSVHVEVCSAADSPFPFPLLARPTKRPAARRQSSAAPSKQPACGPWPTWLRGRDHRGRVGLITHGVKTADARRSLFLEPNDEMPCRHDLEICAVMFGEPQY